MNGRLFRESVKKIHSSKARNEKFPNSLQSLSLKRLVWPFALRSTFILARIAASVYLWYLINGNEKWLVLIPVRASKVQGKTIHLVQLTQEFKLHLLSIKSKTILCSEYRVLIKAESGWVRTGENKLHAACFESDRLNPQRCCNLRLPLRSPQQKSYPTKCLASSTFQDLDLSIYRNLCWSCRLEFYWKEGRYCLSLEDWMRDAFLWVGACKARMIIPVRCEDRCKGVQMLWKCDQCTLRSL